jgi:hypothetical protein
MIYNIIYHYNNEPEAVVEFKISKYDDIGFLVLDELEVRGVTRFNDRFFRKYEELIEWNK